MFEDLIEEKQKYIVKCNRCNQDMRITQEGYERCNGNLDVYNWVCNKCLENDEIAGEVR